MAYLCAPVSVYCMIINAILTYPYHHYYSVATVKYILDNLHTSNDTTAALLPVHSMVFRESDTGE